MNVHAHASYIDAHYWHFHPGWETLFLAHVHTLSKGHVKCLLYVSAESANIVIFNCENQDILVVNVGNWDSVFAVICQDLGHPT